jgi:hypothetical protein
MNIGWWHRFSAPTGFKSVLWEFKSASQTDVVGSAAAIARYVRFKCTFLQVNGSKGLGRNLAALQVNLGAGAYRAIWGYGVDPPADMNPHLRCQLVE